MNLKNNMNMDEIDFFFFLFKIINDNIDINDII